MNNTFGPPKGGVNDGESNIDAAIRETREETSILINKSQISNIDNPIVIEYRNTKNYLYKTIYLYKVIINSVAEIGLESEIVPETKLQLEEVDWAGFVELNNISDKIFWRLTDVMKNL